MRITNVSIKQYRQLADVEIKFYDLTLLVGPNGSGKTTALRALDYALQGENAYEIQHANGVASLRHQIVRLGTPHVAFTVELHDADIKQFRSSLKSAGLNPTSEKARILTFERKATIGENGILDAGKLSFREARELSGEKEGLDNILSGWLLPTLAQSYLIIVADRILDEQRDVTNQVVRVADGRSLMHRLFLADSDRDYGREREFMRFHRCMRSIFPEIARFKPAMRNGNYDLEFDAVPSRWAGGGHREIAVLVGEIALSPGTIVGIEEPERSLHPSLVRHFLECVRTEFAEKQFILATHSGVLVGATPFENTWEFMNGAGARQMTRDEAPMLAERLGIRVADVLDYQLLHLVEGETDEAAWNAWFQKAGLADSCRAVNIEGYGTIKYVVNAKLLEVRRQHPIVCVALDGDLRQKPEGQDKMMQARQLATKMKGKALDLTAHTLEDYLLHAGAIATAFQCDPASVQTWMQEARNQWDQKQKEGTGSKWILGEVLFKAKNLRYKPEHASRIASNIPPDEWHEDIKAGIQAIAALVGRMTSSQVPPPGSPP